MRILFLTSFYSGLQKSVKTGSWNPSGMPAIYKLLEGLKKKEIYFDYCFIDKNVSSSKLYTIDFFKENKFYVLGCLPLNNLPKIINKILFKFIYLFKIYLYLKQIKVKEYDFVYIDRSNVSAFLVIHYIFRVKGVLRLHGIGLQYVKFKKYRSYFFKNILNYISYRLPFKYIIASRDGTPVVQFLDEFTNKKSKKAVMLNGVDLNNNFKNQYVLKNNTINFLFVGRLEKDKGIVEIIEGFKNHNHKNKISLTIIGGGILENYVKDSCLNQSHINYLGTLPHNKVKEYYRKSDVFISFNHLGNISNVVLEAIKYNLLIITFEKDLNLKKDIDSNKFLGDNVIYVKRNKAIILLIQEINTIVNDNKLLSIYKDKTQENLFTKINSWEHRIEEEIKIITTI